METKGKSSKFKCVPVMSDEPKSCSTPRSIAAITDSKRRNWVKNFASSFQNYVHTHTATQPRHSQMQTKEIIWPQNGCGSSPEKVLKLKLHFSVGPHHCRGVIALALMHSLHGSRGEGGRRGKNRKMCCTVE